MPTSRVENQVQVFLLAYVPLVWLVAYHSERKTPVKGSLRGIVVIALLTVSINLANIP
jgi:hypothetical protein